MSIRFLKLSLASPESIRSWTERILPNGKRVGKILKGDLIDYKNGLPIRDGLSCERIFGPMVSFTCTCGRFKCIETRGIHIVHDTLRSSRPIINSVSRLDNDLKVKQWNELTSSVNTSPNSTRLENKTGVPPIISENTISKPIQRRVTHQKPSKKIKSREPVSYSILQPIASGQKKMIRFLASHFLQEKAGYIFCFNPFRPLPFKIKNADFYYDSESMCYFNKNEIVPYFVSIFEEPNETTLIRNNFLKAQTVRYYSKKKQIFKSFNLKEQPLFFPIKNVNSRIYFMGEPKKDNLQFKSYFFEIQNLLKSLHKAIFQIYTGFWFDLKVYYNNFVYEKHIFLWVPNRKSKTTLATPLKGYNNFHLHTSFSSQLKVQGFYHKSQKLPIITKILPNQTNFFHLKRFNTPRFFVMSSFLVRIIRNNILFLQKKNEFFFNSTKTKKREQKERIGNNWYIIVLLHNISLKNTINFQKNFLTKTFIYWLQRNQQIVLPYVFPFSTKLKASPPFNNRCKRVCVIDLSRTHMFEKTKGYSGKIDIYNNQQIIALYFAKKTKYEKNIINITNQRFSLETSPLVLIGLLKKKHICKLPLLFHSRFSFSKLNLSFLYHIASDSILSYRGPCHSLESKKKNLRHDRMQDSQATVPNKISLYIQKLIVFNNHDISPLTIPKEKCVFFNFWGKHYRKTANIWFGSLKISSFDLKPGLANPGLRRKVLFALRNHNFQRSISRAFPYDQKRPTSIFDGFKKQELFPWEKVKTMLFVLYHPSSSNLADSLSNFRKTAISIRREVPFLSLNSSNYQSIQKENFSSVSADQREDISYSTTRLQAQPDSVVSKQDKMYDAIESQRTVWNKLRDKTNIVSGQNLPLNLTESNYSEDMSKPYVASNTKQNIRVYKFKTFPPEEIRYCPYCEVELLPNSIRRYRLGYIEFISPVTHIWYTASSIPLLLNLSKTMIEAIASCHEALSSGFPPVYKWSYNGESPTSWTFQMQPLKLPIHLVPTVFPSDSYTLKKLNCTEILLPSNSMISQTFKQARVPLNGYKMYTPSFRIFYHEFTRLRHLCKNNFTLYENRIKNPFFQNRNISHKDLRSEERIREQNNDELLYNNFSSSHSADFFDSRFHTRFKNFDLNRNNFSFTVPRILRNIFPYHLATPENQTNEASLWPLDYNDMEQYQTEDESINSRVNKKKTNQKTTLATPFNKQKNRNFLDTIQPIRKRKSIKVLSFESDSRTLFKAAYKMSRESKLEPFVQTINCLDERRPCFEISKTGMPKNSLLDFPQTYLKKPKNTLNYTNHHHLNIRDHTFFNKKKMAKQFFVISLLKSNHFGSFYSMDKRSLLYGFSMFNFPTKWFFDNTKTSFSAGPFPQTIYCLGKTRFHFKQPRFLNKPGPRSHFIIINGNAYSKMKMPYFIPYQKKQLCFLHVKNTDAARGLILNSGLLKINMNSRQLERLFFMLLEKQVSSLYTKGENWLAIEKHLPLIKRELATHFNISNETMREFSFFNQIPKKVKSNYDLYTATDYEKKREWLKLEGFFEDPSDKKLPREATRDNSQVNENIDNQNISDCSNEKHDKIEKKNGSLHEENDYKSFDNLSLPLVLPFLGKNPDNIEFQSNYYNPENFQIDPLKFIIHLFTTQHIWNCNSFSATGKYINLSTDSNESKTNTNNNSETFLQKQHYNHTWNPLDITSNHLFKAARCLKLNIGPRPCFLGVKSIAAYLNNQYMPSVLDTNQTVYRKNNLIQNHNLLNKFAWDFSLFPSNPDRNEETSHHASSVVFSPSFKPLQILLLNHNKIRKAKPWERLKPLGRWWGKALFAKQWNEIQNQSFWPSLNKFFITSDNLFSKTYPFLPINYQNFLFKDILKSTGGRRPTKVLFRGNKPVLNASQKKEIQELANFKYENDLLPLQEWYPKPVNMELWSKNSDFTNYRKNYQDYYFRKLGRNYYYFKLEQMTRLKNACGVTSFLKNLFYRNKFQKTSILHSWETTSYFDINKTKLKTCRTTAKLFNNNNNFAFRKKKKIRARSSDDGFLDFLFGFDLNIHSFSAGPFPFVKQLSSNFDKLRYSSSTFPYHFANNQIFSTLMKEKDYLARFTTSIKRAKFFMYFKEKKSLWPLELNTTNHDQKLHINNFDHAFYKHVQNMYRPTLYKKNNFQNNFLESHVPFVINKKMKPKWSYQNYFKNLEQTWFFSFKGPAEELLKTSKAKTQRLQTWELDVIKTPNIFLSESALTILKKDVTYFPRETNIVKSIWPIQSYKKHWSPVLFWTPNLEWEFKKQKSTLVGRPVSITYDYSISRFSSLMKTITRLETKQIENQKQGSNRPEGGNPLEILHTGVAPQEKHLKKWIINQNFPAMVLTVNHFERFWLKTYFGNFNKTIKNWDLFLYYTSQNYNKKTQLPVCVNHKSYFFKRVQNQVYLNKQRSCLFSPSSCLGSLYSSTNTKTVKGRLKHEYESFLKTWSLFNKLINYQSHQKNSYNNGGIKVKQKLDRLALVGFNTTKIEFFGSLKIYAKRRFLKIWLDADQTLKQKIPRGATFLLFKAPPRNYLKEMARQDLKLNSKYVSNKKHDYIDLINGSFPIIDIKKVNSDFQITNSQLKIKTKNHDSFFLFNQKRSTFLWAKDTFVSLWSHRKEGTKRLININPKFVFTRQKQLKTRLNSNFTLKQPSWKERVLWFSLNQNKQALLSQKTIQLPYLEPLWNKLRYNVKRATTMKNKRQVSSKIIKFLWLNQNYDLNSIPLVKLVREPQTIGHLNYTIKRHKSTICYTYALETIQNKKQGLFPQVSSSIISSQSTKRFEFKSKHRNPIQSLSLKISCFSYFGYGPIVSLNFNSITLPRNKLISKKKSAYHQKIIIQRIPKQIPLGCFKKIRFVWKIKNARGSTIKKPIFHLKNTKAINDTQFKYNSNLRVIHAQTFNGCSYSPIFKWGERGHIFDKITRVSNGYFFYKTSNSNSNSHKSALNSRSKQNYKKNDMVPSLRSALLFKSEQSERTGRNFSYQEGTNNNFSSSNNTSHEARWWGNKKVLSYSDSLINEKQQAFPFYNNKMGTRPLFLNKTAAAKVWKVNTNYYACISQITSWGSDHGSWILFLKYIRANIYKGDQLLPAYFNKMNFQMMPRTGSIILQQLLSQLVLVPTVSQEGLLNQNLEANVALKQESLPQMNSWQNFSTNKRPQRRTKNNSMAITKSLNKNDYNLLIRNSSSEEQLINAYFHYNSSFFSSPTMLPKATFNKSSKVSNINKTSRFFKNDLHKIIRSKLKNSLSVMKTFSHQNNSFVPTHFSTFNINMFYNNYPAVPFPKTINWGTQNACLYFKIKMPYLFLPTRFSYYPANGYITLSGAILNNMRKQQIQPNQKINTYLNNSEKFDKKQAFPFYNNKMGTRPLFYLKTGAAKFKLFNDSKTSFIYLKNQTNSTFLLPKNNFQHKHQSLKTNTMKNNVNNINKYTLFAYKIKKPVAHKRFGQIYELPSSKPNNWYRLNNFFSYEPIEGLNVQLASIFSNEPMASMAYTDGFEFLKDSSLVETEAESQTLNVLLNGYKHFSNSLKQTESPNWLFPFAKNGIIKDGSYQKSTIVDNNTNFNSNSKHTIANQKNNKRFGRKNHYFSLDGLMPGNNSLIGNDTRILKLIYSLIVSFQLQFLPNYARIKQSNNRCRDNKKLLNSSFSPIISNHVSRKAINQYPTNTICHSYYHLYFSRESKWCRKNSLNTKLRSSRFSSIWQPSIKKTSIKSNKTDRKVGTCFNKCYNSFLQNLRWVSSYSAKLKGTSHSFINKRKPIQHTLIKNNHFFSEPSKMAKIFDFSNLFILNKVIGWEPNSENQKPRLRPRSTNGVFKPYSNQNYSQITEKEHFYFSNQKIKIYNVLISPVKASTLPDQTEGENQTFGFPTTPFDFLESVSRNSALNHKNTKLLFASSARDYFGAQKWFYTKPINTSRGNIIKADEAVYNFHFDKRPRPRNLKTFGYNLKKNQFLDHYQENWLKHEFKSILPIHFETYKGQLESEILFIKLKEIGNYNALLKKKDTIFKTLILKMNSSLDPLLSLNQITNNGLFSRDQIKLIKIASFHKRIYRETPFPLAMISQEKKWNQNSIFDEPNGFSNVDHYFDFNDKQQNGNLTKKVLKKLQESFVRLRSNKRRNSVIYQYNQDTEHFFISSAFSPSHTWLGEKAEERIKKFKQPKQELVNRLNFFRIWLFLDSIHCLYLHEFNHVKNKHKINSRGERWWAFITKKLAFYRTSNRVKFPDHNSSLNILQFYEYRKNFLLKKIFKQRIYLTQSILWKRSILDHRLITRFKPTQPIIYQNIASNVIHTRKNKPGLLPQVIKRFDFFRRLSFSIFCLNVFKQKTRLPYRLIYKADAEFQKKTNHDFNQFTYWKKNSMFDQALSILPYIFNKRVYTKPRERSVAGERMWRGKLALFSSSTPLIYTNASKSFHNPSTTYNQAFPFYNNKMGTRPLFLNKTGAAKNGLTLVFSQKNKCSEATLGQRLIGFQIYTLIKRSINRFYDQDQSQIVSDQNHSLDIKYEFKPFGPQIKHNSIYNDWKKTFKPQISNLNSNIFDSFSAGPFKNQTRFRLLTIPQLFDLKNQNNLLSRMPKNQIPINILGPLLFSSSIKSSRQVTFKKQLAFPVLKYLASGPHYFWGTYNVFSHNNAKQSAEKNDLYNNLQPKNSDPITSDFYLFELKKTISPKGSNSTYKAARCLESNIGPRPCFLRVKNTGADFHESYKHDPIYKEISQSRVASQSSIYGEETDFNNERPLSSETLFREENLKVSSSYKALLQKAKILEDYVVPNPEPIDTKLLFLKLLNGGLPRPIGWTLQGTILSNKVSLFGASYLSYDEINIYPCFYKKNTNSNSISWKQIFKKNSIKSNKLTSQFIWDGNQNRFKNLIPSKSKLDNSSQIQQKPSPSSSVSKNVFSIRDQTKFKNETMTNLNDGTSLVGPKVSKKKQKVDKNDTFEPFPQTVNRLGKTRFHFGYSKIGMPKIKSDSFSKKSLFKDQTFNRLSTSRLSTFLKRKNNTRDLVAISKSPKRSGIFNYKRNLRKLRLQYLRNFRRLRFIEYLKATYIKPEWMILSLLPVLPPDLRPVIANPRGYITGDLNTHYQNVIYRSNNIEKLLDTFWIPRKFYSKVAFSNHKKATDLMLSSKKSYFYWPQHLAMDKQRLLKLKTLFGATPNFISKLFSNLTWFPLTFLYENKIKKPIPNKKSDLTQKTSSSAGPFSFQKTFATTENKPVNQFVKLLQNTSSKPINHLLYKTPFTHDDSKTRFQTWKTQNNNSDNYFLGMFILDKSRTNTRHFPLRTGSNTKQINKVHSHGSLIRVFSNYRKNRQVSLLKKNALNRNIVNHNLSMKKPFRSGISNGKHFNIQPHLLFMIINKTCSLINNLLFLNPIQFKNISQNHLSVFPLGLNYSNEIIRDQNFRLVDVKKSFFNDFQNTKANLIDWKLERFISPMFFKFTSTRFDKNYFPISARLSKQKSLITFNKEPWQQNFIKNNGNFPKNPHRETMNSFSPVYLDLSITHTRLQRFLTGTDSSKKTIPLKIYTQNGHDHENELLLNGRIHYKPLLKFYSHKSFFGSNFGIATGYNEIVETFKLQVINHKLAPCLSMKSWPVFDKNLEIHSPYSYTNGYLAKMENPVPPLETKLIRTQALHDSKPLQEMQYSLQKAVDALIDNSQKLQSNVLLRKGRPLKSLSDNLKGKEGRFRQHLLGKRVDYSGRSVIVVGPDLKLYECGIPLIMALRLFQPFLILYLIYRFKIASLLATQLIQRKHPMVINLLKKFIETWPIILNRAPTLHRMNIQAFKIRLVQGKAILLHPLVCSSYNADFDGDQMGVHVPITQQARAESWKLLWSINNSISIASRQPLFLPSQDMVIGNYYLTAPPIDNNLNSLILKRQWSLNSNIENKTQFYNASNYFLAPESAKKHGYLNQGFSNKKSTLSSESNTCLSFFSFSQQSSSSFHKMNHYFFSLEEAYQYYLNRVYRFHVNTPVWFRFGMVFETSEREKPIEITIDKHGNTIYTTQYYEKQLKRNRILGKNRFYFSTHLNSMLALPMYKQKSAAVFINPLSTHTDTSKFLNNPSTNEMSTHTKAMILPCLIVFNKNLRPILLNQIIRSTFGRIEFYYEAFYASRLGFISNS